MRRLERMYAVAEEIRRRAPAPVRAAELAERFGVSRRTIERDLAALQAAGVPLYAHLGRGGGTAIDPRSGRAALTLSASEATALVLALSVAEGMPFADDAGAALARLLDALPDADRVRVDELRGRIRTPVGLGPTVSTRVRTTLEEAVRVGGVVRLSYVDGEGRATVRDVEAVGFLGGTGSWYLIGWCRLREAGRIFRFDRIRTATLTRERVPARDVDETLGWVPDPVVAP